MPETDIQDGFDEIEHKFPGTKEKLKRYGSPFCPSLRIQPFLIAPRRQGCFARRNDFPLFLEIFRWNDPKSRVSFTFQPDFPERFCKW